MYDNIMVVSLLSFCVLVIALFGFLVTLIIGKSVKNVTTLKVGKIGSIASLCLAIVCYGTYAFVGNLQEKELRNQRIAFRKNAIDFQSQFLTIATDVEKIGSDVSDKWQDAILNDKNISDVVIMTINSHNKKIDKIRNKMKDLHNSLLLLKINDTGDLELKYKDFEKGYNELDDFLQLTSSPDNESYSSFIDKYNTLDNKLVSFLKKVQRFNN